MPSGRKPIFSVENSLDFTINVETNHLLVMSGLLPAEFFGNQIAELNDSFRMRFDIAGAPRRLFWKKFFNNLQDPGDYLSPCKLASRPNRRIAKRIAF
jgi:hypothetical protein